MDEIRRRKKKRTYLRFPKRVFRRKRNSTNAETMIERICCVDDTSNEAKPSKWVFIYCVRRKIDCMFIWRHETRKKKNKEKNKIKRINVITYHVDIMWISYCALYRNADFRLCSFVSFSSYSLYTYSTMSNFICLFYFSSFFARISKTLPVSVRSEPINFVS